MWQRSPERAFSHLQFHPTSSDLVIATGDKQGHIALWDVDKKTSHQVSSGPCVTQHCTYRISGAVRIPPASGVSAQAKFDSTVMSAIAVFQHNK